MSGADPLDVSDELAAAAAEYANKLTKIDPMPSDAVYARLSVGSIFLSPTWPTLTAAFIAGARFGERRALDELRNVVRGDKADEPICLCHATSEYDPPCPRHGVLGIGVQGVS